MKIGVVIDRLNVGGVEKIAIEEVIALRKLGEDADLVILRDKPVVQNAFPDLLQDVPIVYLDKRLPKILRFSFSFPVFKFFSLFHITYPVFLPFVVKKNEYDYLIVHGTYTCFSVITIGKLRKIKFSLFIWDPISYILTRVYSSKFFAPLMWLLKKLAYMLDKFLINNTDKVLVGGSAHNDFIHAINPNKSIKVIYPSVHPAKKPLNKDTYVLMVTAWKDGKHPEYIFEILKQLPDLHIKMVGKWTDPLYRQEFDAKVKEQGYTKTIDIVGGVSETELSNYYAHALVLLQTNDDRGFGMPAMEAAGAATTFIIPTGQGVCDLFVDGKDGFYTKENDTKTICKLLKNLLDDPEEAAQIGTRAWKRVRDNYSWAIHAEQLRSLVNNSKAED